MSTLPDLAKHPAPTTDPDPTLDPQEERRRRRIAALKAAEGLWKNRTDIPNDGLEYQEQLRAEWRVIR
ncbi:hypothetical protein [Massilia sp. BJB1822]|uniref:hypothetical protein n=1 Tax=Massilia sp. BJB1822 TaxID=2744470 RepID=UPI0015934157|nr:hypothetical protein [Massilia sp. BJB1822]NVE01888.1 hypothetical protein [Massilia sp. BJB1822]